MATTSLLFGYIMVFAWITQSVSSMTLPFLKNSIANANKLGKKSTALEVLKELKSSDRLAYYVTKGGRHRDAPGTAIVTGGNTGIGIITVATLAEAGMTVILCTRNIEKGRTAIEKNIPKQFHKQVSVQQLDLADMNSIQTACAQLRNENESIEVIVNNAGVMSPPTKMETSQKLELQFGTNHVGHHLFTRLLLPNVNKHGRIVTVASSAHSMGNPGTGTDWGTKSYSPWGAYGDSKLANIYFAKELQDRLVSAGQNNIDSVTLHPGVISTNLWQYSPSVAQKLVGVFLADKTVEQGAATSVYCALSTDVEGGGYYDNCQLSTPKLVADDSTAQKQLWDYTERLIIEEGFELPVQLLGVPQESLLEVQ
mmetsp:Transcript_42325/g.45935  ORF Transcript_42325/g.45935 Transcript_42325/m.45935 type:complete len:368 (+) Transcript_42325:36-1139(+)